MIHQVILHCYDIQSKLSGSAGMPVAALSRFFLFCDKSLAQGTNTEPSFIKDLPGSFRNL
jgi:hypothetical protein